MRAKRFYRTRPLSIIGATENRRDQLCCVFSVLSVTSLISVRADVVPFSAARSAPSSTGDILHGDQNVRLRPSLDGQGLSRDYPHECGVDVAAGSCVRPVWRFTKTAAIMGSEDRSEQSRSGIADNYGRSKWVDMIADRPALHYVLFALATGTSRRTLGVISFKPQARPVPCSVRPLAMIAHVILAIMLASATAATFVGRSASNAVSQGRCFVPWILA